MRKFSVSLPVSEMIVKQGKNFTTANKMVCKTLFVTVTILSPNLLLNDCCFKIIVDTPKIRKTFTWRRWHFYTISAAERWRFLFKYWAHCFICSTYVTLRHYVDVKTSLALPSRYAVGRHSTAGKRRFCRVPTRQDYYGKLCKGVFLPSKQHSDHTCWLL